MLQCHILFSPVFVFPYLSTFFFFNLYRSVNWTNYILVAVTHSENVWRILFLLFRSTNFWSTSSGSRAVECTGNKVSPQVVTVPNNSTTLALAYHKPSLNSHQIFLFFFPDLKVLQTNFKLEPPKVNYLPQQNLQPMFGWEFVCTGHMVWFINTTH